VRLVVVHLALMFVAATSIDFSVSSAMASPKSIAAFCKAHPDLDFPDHTFYAPTRRGDLPGEVAAVAATNWRCMDNKVYVCNGGASGSACLEDEPSREPSREIRETCEDNPGQSLVAIAVIGNSSSTWRCQGTTAKIIKTVPLDVRGFMKGTWFPLFDAHGAINADIQFDADPR